MLSQCQRNFILIIVILIIRPQTDENRQVTVGKVIDIELRSLSMRKQLQAFILTQVVVRILIDGACIHRCQICYFQRKRLFVLLAYLRLARVQYASNTRRQDVVDRIAIAVFFYIDSRNFQCTFDSRRHFRVGQVLLIATPFTANQLQRTETQHDGFPESGHIHTHETDRLEVVDRTDTTLVFLDRYLKLVPGNSLLLIIRQTNRARTLVCNEVRTYHCIFRSNSHFILEILLVFIQRIILVDIFHIRYGFGRCAVTLRRIIDIFRVTFRTVIAFVAG